MSDFSIFSLFTAGLACMIPLSAAYTQPKGDAPKGNPISQPGLNSVVPAGKGFTIEWKPTTKGTVTLVLLKGPSSNAEPQYPIAEKTQNNGTYIWVPSTDLQPSDPDTPDMGYGIQLIDDATGQYQYTTQFGISNPKYKAGDDSDNSGSGGSSSGGSMIAYPPMYQTRSQSAPSYESSSAPSYGQHSSSAPAYHQGGHMTMTSAPAYQTPSGSASGMPKPTWYSTPKASPDHNVTMIAPSYSAPSSTLVHSATSAPSVTQAKNSTASPTGGPFTGSASSMTSSFAGLVFAAAIAVFAL